MQKSGSGNFYGHKRSIFTGGFRIKTAKPQ
jgi:hypothetical protein